MVKPLLGEVEQLKQSYSGGDSEGESESQTQEAEPAEYASDQQSYHEMIKTQSDPNLARRVAGLNPGKTEQSVQTLFPCEHRRPASEQEPQLCGSGLAVHLLSSPAYIPPFIPHLSALATTTKPLTCCSCGSSFLSPCVTSASISFSIIPGT